MVAAMQKRLGVVSPHHLDSNVIATSCAFEAVSRIETHNITAGIAHSNFIAS